MKRYWVVVMTACFLCSRVNRDHTNITSCGFGDPERCNTSDQLHEGDFDGNHAPARPHPFMQCTTVDELDRGALLSILNCQWRSATIGNLTSTAAAAAHCSGRRSFSLP
ncbi:hypothetical protein PFISCL1PPCAC_11530, partial [Pristionchus fissidentatus]